MASTDSLPEPTFTKPITEMAIAELRQTCLFFQLSPNGITPTLRTRLRTFLSAHKDELQHDYDYTALYPNRDPIPNRIQPRQASQGSQAYSQWNGIGNQDTIPQAASVRAASLAPMASGRVEEYLHGKSTISSQNSIYLPFSSSINEHSHRSSIEPLSFSLARPKNHQLC
jgi:hypothetical protein